MTDQQSIEEVASDLIMSANGMPHVGRRTSSEPNEYSHPEILAIRYQVAARLPYHFLYVSLLRTVLRTFCIIYNINTVLVTESFWNKRFRAASDLAHCLRSRLAAGTSSSAAVVRCSPVHGGQHKNQELN